MKYIFLVLLVLLSASQSFSEELKVKDEKGRVTGYIVDTPSGRKVYDSKHRVQEVWKETKDGYKVYNKNNKLLNTIEGD